MNAAKQRKYGSNIDNCIKCFEANIAMVLYSFVLVATKHGSNKVSQR